MSPVVVSESVSMSSTVSAAEMAYPALAEVPTSTPPNMNVLTESEKAVLMNPNPVDDKEEKDVFFDTEDQNNQKDEEVVVESENKKERSSIEHKDWELYTGLFVWKYPDAWFRERNGNIRKKKAARKQKKEEEKQSKSPLVTVTPPDSPTTPVSRLSAAEKMKDESTSFNSASTNEDNLGGVVSSCCREEEGNIPVPTNLPVTSTSTNSTTTMEDPRKNECIAACLIMLCDMFSDEN